MDLRRLKGQVGSRVPVRAKHALRRTFRRVRRAEEIDWGDLRRLEPFSIWGVGRGTPLERYYVDRFIAVRARLVRGRVLEVGATEYARRFGRGVTGTDVVDIDAGNPLATRVGDLGTPGVLEPAGWDCVLLLFMLQYPKDLGVAVGQAWEAVAPGGALFLAVPGLTRLDPYNPANDRHRFTPVGLRELLEDHCPGGEIELETYGNLLVVVAYFLGLAAEDLTDAELQVQDPDYPLVHAAVVRRPGFAPR